LQRWLIKEEKKIYFKLKNVGVALNTVEPEIVPTVAAEKEYQEEVNKINKEHDKKISAKRKSVKEKIAFLEKKIEPDRIILSKLQNEYREKADLMKNSTGWRRLIHGRAVGYNPVNEGKRLEELKKEILKLKPEVNSVVGEIYKLREEYRLLRRQFSKVSMNSYVRRMAKWGSLGGTKIRITE
jgi:chromosome segregation ATPase